MDELRFILHMAAALVLGAALGLERQYRGHPAGLRTNALVSVGAALFVALGRLYAGPNVDPTRIASYVVSGIGFLGGGVILREGFNVRGMNTAATLWCTAAVGSLCGADFLLQACVGAALVLTIHLGLRPVAHWIDAQRKTSPDVESAYRVRVVCAEKEQALVRTIVLRHLNGHKGMVVQGISLVDCDQSHRVAVAADVFSHQRDDRAMEDLVARLNIEPSVTAVSWERRQ